MSRRSSRQALQHPRHPSSSLTEALLSAEEKGAPAAARDEEAASAPVARPLWGCCKTLVLLMLRDSPGGGVDQGTAVGT